MGVLKCYFLKDASRDRVMHDFIARGAYTLHLQTGTGTTELDGWYGVQAGMKIIISAVFEQVIFSDKHYRCPRPQCRAWTECKKVNDGWIEW
jgi:hypothetical protein